ncbi:MAG TPA: hypothetical protein DDZ04_03165 [Parabacteroides sp.]|nr:hypothetical protein [Parabacteroides sp.]
MGRFTDGKYWFIPETKERPTEEKGDGFHEQPIVSASPGMDPPLLAGSSGCHVSDPHYIPPTHSGNMAARQEV